MWSIIVAAGWPIWPLIFTSIIGMAILIERGLFLRRTQIVPDNLADDVIKSITQFKEQTNLTRLSRHSALGSILSEGLRAHFKALDPIQAMEQKGEEVKISLEKNLDFLGLIATAAPLMGLLGTVVGMIEIFAVQGQDFQSPEALATGIAVALYNTAFGLIVAIPAMIGHKLYKVKIDHTLLALENAIKPLEDTFKAAKINAQRQSTPMNL